jgi:hypothetical protein
VSDPEPGGAIRVGDDEPSRGTVEVYDGHGLEFADTLAERLGATAR